MEEEDAILPKDPLWYKWSLRMQSLILVVLLKAVAISYNLFSNGLFVRES